jgi:hypothetical protein
MNKARAAPMAQGLPRHAIAHIRARTKSAPGASLLVAANAAP